MQPSLPGVQPFLFLPFPPFAFPARLQFPLPDKKVGVKGKEEGSRTRWAIDLRGKSRSKEARIIRNVTTSRVATRGSTALERKVKTRVMRIEGFYLLLDVVGGSWGRKKREKRQVKRGRKERKEENEKKRIKINNKNLLLRRMAYSIKWWFTVLYRWIHVVCMMMYVVGLAHSSIKATSHILLH